MLYDEGEILFTNYIIQSDLIHKFEIYRHNFVFRLVGEQLLNWPFIAFQSFKCHLKYFGYSIAADVCKYCEVSTISIQYAKLSKFYYLM